MTFICSQFTKYNKVNCTKFHQLSKLIKSQDSPREEHLPSSFKAASLEADKYVLYVGPSLKSLPSFAAEWASCFCMVTGFS